jgi:hypothetical protein
LKQTLRLLALAAVTIITSVPSAHAALNLEGQSGVFLNAFAYNVAEGKTEASSHYVNLNDLGNATTYSITRGFRSDLELGYTRIASSVSGIKDQNDFLAKWLAVKETPKSPAVALWVIHKDLVGGPSATDFGVSATKVLTVAKKPLLVDLGARSTKALGLGLFGVGDSRETKFEGSIAYQIVPKLWVGTEFKQQIGADAWKDIAARYAVSDKLNLDAGVANLNSALDNQLALGATYSW